MQTALVEILLNGSLNNTVVREVTAAEVPVLRHIHGNDAVVNAKPVPGPKRTNSEEFDRLKAFYGDEVIGKVFPGAMPKLPSTLVEVGLIDAPAGDDEIKILKK